MKEKTGTVSAYDWTEGEYRYNVDQKEYIQNPRKLFTWTAPETGMGLFYVDDPDYDEPWLPVWRFQGESEFRGTNFNVEKGGQIEIELWPRVYDEGYFINEDMEMIQWWKFHTQGGSVKYDMTYTETIESILDADFTYSPSNPTLGQSIQITSQSTVVNAEIVSIKWYLNGDHQANFDGVESWSWTPSKAGTYLFELEVTDSTGNYDFAIDNISVEEESSYTVMDATLCTGLSNNEPVDRKTSFTKGDDIVFWMKLGNVKGDHSVYIEWETPRERETLTNTRIEVPAPSIAGSQHVVSHAITKSDLIYNQIINDPGGWTISVWIDSKTEYRYEFQIDSNVEHIFEISKSKVITGELVDLQGTVLLNGEPVEGADIILEVLQNGELMDESSGFSTNADGSYSAFYAITHVDDPLSRKRETWTLRTIAVYNGQRFVAEKEIQVMHIGIDINQIKLVQTLETTPTGQSYKLAGDKEAGVRVTLNIPARKGSRGFTRPVIGVIFEVKQNNRVVYTDPREINGVSKIKDYDFFFTLPPGSYTASLRVDPESIYTHTNMKEEYWKSLSKEWTLEVKEMEPLHITFIPVDMWEGVTGSAEDTQRYKQFCEGQIELIKDTYPLPDSKFSFTIDERNRKSPFILKTFLTYMGKYMAAITWLNQEAVSIGTKVIAVLPATTEWWEKPATLDKQGFAWSFASTKASGVKSTAHVGVSAHEIAHQLGLYTWIEQYTWVSHGITVEGLILKDGVIYDLSKIEDMRRAFTVSTSIAKCFMGTNAGGSTGTWVSEEAYLKLVDVLGDPPHAPVLQVTGLINNTGLFNNQIIEYIGLPDIWPEGRFSIKLVDSNGGVLYEKEFGGDADETFFSFSVLFPSNTRRIEYYKDGSLIASQDVSGNAPTSIIDSFNSQGDSASLSWSVSDLDQDEVSSTVVYSNNGVNWLMLDMNNTDNTLNFDFTGLPGGDECYVKVITHDGVRTGETVYGPFTAPKNTPQAIITSHEDSEVFGTGLTLTGIGYDLDDGEITDTLSWSSNIDGSLGAGKTIWANLSLGNHVISLEVTDRDGNKATDQVTVVTQETQVITFESHILTNTVPELGVQPQARSVFLHDETINSVVSFSSVGGGDNVTWIFTGPGVMKKYYSETESTTLVTYLPFNLAEYPLENAIGYWEVDVYVNGNLVDTQGVMVEKRQESTGFVWWGGAVGILVIGSVLVGGYLVLKKRGSKDSQSTPQTQPKSVAQTQQFCPECGKPATWIEQYKRWYCYDCEKYLE